MIHHQPGCPRPGTELTTGTQGDEMERCTYCKAWTPLVKQPPPPRFTRRGRAVNPVDVLPMFAPAKPVRVPTPKLKRPPGQAAPQPLVSRYRCATHLDQPVTWKGTGCLDCSREHHKTSDRNPGRRTERNH